MESNIIDNIKQLKKLQDKKAKLKNTLSEINSEIDQLKSDLAKYMEHHDLQNIKVKGVGTAFLTPVFFARINKENYPKLLQWLDDNALGNLAPRKISPQTFQALYRERLENNEPVPGPDIAEVKTIKETRLLKKSK